MSGFEATSIQTAPRDGLWGYYKGQFEALFFDSENCKLDHVTWFGQLGWPDYGATFDLVLRGRMLWDWQYDRFTLLYYGSVPLPNNVYQLVLDYFNPQGFLVVEKRSDEVWR